MQNLSYRQPSANLRLPSLLLIALLHFLVAGIWLQHRSTQHQTRAAETLSYLDLRLLPAPLRPQPAAPESAVKSVSTPRMTRKVQKVTAHTEALTNDSSQAQATAAAQPSPAPAAEAPIQLDLDSLRQQASRNEKTREKGHMDVLQNEQLRDQSLEAKLNDGARRAQRTDCRAYAGTGLLAPLVAVVDVARGKPCKW